MRRHSSGFKTKEVRVEEKRMEGGIRGAVESTQLHRRTAPSIGARCTSSNGTKYASVLRPSVFVKDLHGAADDSQLRQGSTVVREALAFEVAATCPLKAAQAHQKIRFYGSAIAALRKHGCGTYRFQPEGALAAIVQRDMARVAADAAATPDATVGGKAAKVGRAGVKRGVRSASSFFLASSKVSGARCVSATPQRGQRSPPRQQQGTCHRSNRTHAARPATASSAPQSFLRPSAQTPPCDLSIEEHFLRRGLRPAALRNFVTHVSDVEGTHSSHLPQQESGRGIDSILSRSDAETCFAQRGDAAGTSQRHQKQQDDAPRRFHFSLVQGLISPEEMPVIPGPQKECVADARRNVENTRAVEAQQRKREALLLRKRLMLLHQDEEFWSANRAPNATRGHLESVALLRSRNLRRVARDD